MFPQLCLPWQSTEGLWILEVLPCKLEPVTLTLWTIPVHYTRDPGPAATPWLPPDSFNSIAPPPYYDLCGVSAAAADGSLSGHRPGQGTLPLQALTPPLHLPKCYHGG